MTKKNLADSIKVSSPCNEDWEAMTGNKKVRFCSHCDLNVTNISEMTRREAMRLVKKSNGKLCVRYIQNPKTKAPVFADKLYQIGRRVRVAAGILGASLAVSTAVYAQGGISLGAKNLDENSKNVSLTDKKNDPKKDKTASIFGTVSDSNGAVIPNAEVTLINQENNQKILVLSNEIGIYEFKNVIPANYSIEFEASYFKKHIIENVKINSQESAKFDASLEVDNVVEIMGAMVISIVRTPFENAILDGNAKLVQDFISRGANVNEKDQTDEGSMPLHLAVENGSTEIIQILLNSGADINAKDNYGNTPLLKINETTSLETLRLLIKYGANPNEANEDGNTPLMRAAEVENYGAVIALLESGADPNMKNSDGETARDLAGDEKTEKLLEGYGAIVEEDAG